MINWDIEKTERELIFKIVERAEKIADENSIEFDRMTLQMDIMATHLNGCKIDLDRLLDTDDFNFCHDVYGINRHINRETGKLENFFVPRFASKEIVIEA